MILEIRKKGDPVLRGKALPVHGVSRELIELTDNMLETMYHASGVGLAAPQVGVPIRAIVVDTGEGPVVLFNPEIAQAQGLSLDSEGCLSIPGVYGVVERAWKVTVKGLDRGGKETEVTGEGLFARALQHEIDHLDGVLFIDKARDIIEGDIRRGVRRG